MEDFAVVGGVRRLVEGCNAGNINVNGRFAAGNKAHGCSERKDVVDDAVHEGDALQDHATQPAASGPANDLTQRTEAKYSRLEYYAGGVFEP